jgi:hypothetical protein
MAELIVLNDLEIEARINFVRDRVNASGAQMRVFVNDIEPAPDDVPADYTDADYEGAPEPFDLEDDWTEPVKVEPGKWMMQTSVHEIPPPDSGSVTIYGVYVLRDTDSTPKVVMAARLLTPIELFSHSDELPIRLRFRDWSSPTLIAEVCS